MLHQGGYPAELADCNGTLLLTDRGIGDDAGHLLKEIDVGLCSQQLNADSHS